MGDDFFDKIDAKLNEQKNKKAAKEETADTNRAWIKNVIPGMVEIAEAYAAKCNERGMNAKVKHYDYSISFTLRYKEGQERTLAGGPQHDMNNKLSFEDHFPDNNGKRYKTMPMDWYDESNWSNEIYEAKLKKLIEDFVFYADRFGGV